MKYKFFKQVKITPITLITKWIFTLFGTVFPLKSLHKLYDKIFKNGWPFIYQVIIGINNNKSI